jgi:predicted alpha-1,2-mannosidase
MTDEKDTQACWSRRAVLKGALTVAVGSSLGGLLPEMAGAAPRARKRPVLKPAHAATQMAEDLLSLVNPMQGTASNPGFSHGNTLPLVARPFGMTHWAAQTGAGDGWFFDPGNHKLQGVRATHQPSPWMGDYGHFTVMGQVGESVFSPEARAAAYDPVAMAVHPHAFSVMFQSGLRMEMAPTERCAVFRFTSTTAQPLRVILDSHHAAAVGTDGRSLIGRSRKNNGGVSGDFACYFAAVFDRPFLRADTTRDGNPTGQASLEGENIGAFAEFDGTAPVVMRIATSFISVEQAQHNLAREIAARSFEDVRDEAAAQWRDTLGRVRIDGGTHDQRRTFYSCLYRAHLFPRMLHEFDTAGQPLHYSPYDGQTHPGVLYGDSGFWDTYRTLYPLLSILQPARMGEMVQGFVNAYREGGWLPQWPSPGYRAVMIGTHIDSVIAEAFVKGLPGFDREAALAGLLHDANDIGDPHDRYGRVGLPDYLSKGYVPCDLYDKATARSLDYVYDDFCISQAAGVLGRNSEQQSFRSRALNYRKLYDPGLGFFWGKNSDGTWKSGFDQYAWGGPYVEGGPWQSTWAVPHDPAGLITLMGGQEKFLAKLDRFLYQPPTFHPGTYGGVIHEMAEMGAVPFGQYDQGNQPVHLVLYLFTAAGSPWKTQYWTRRVMDRLYSPDGFAGDEDNGEMSSWYVLNALGIYPLCPGHPSYVFGSPLFPEAHIDLAGGKTLTLRAPGNTPETVYANRVAVNGVPQDRLWVGYDELIRGGTIDFTMAKAPVLRSLGAKDLPFSLSPYPAMTPQTAFFPIALNINCGGDAIGDFVGDCFAEGSGGTAQHDNAISANSPKDAPDVVYQSERYGAFTYTLPMPMLPGGKTYTLRLHFAEIADDTPGKRLMDVHVNGKPVLTGWDLFAEAGMNKAVVKEYTGLIPDQHGSITVALAAASQSPDQNAKLSGLQIFST